MTNDTITKATDDDKRKVRHFTFHKDGRYSGTVTGIALDVDCKRIRMYSAGCLHGTYEVKGDRTLVSAEPLSL